LYAAGAIKKTMDSVIEMRLAKWIHCETRGNLAKPSVKTIGNWKLRVTYRGDAAFATWLHRVAVNVVLVHLCKTKCVEVSLDEMADEQDTGSSHPAELRTYDFRLAACVGRVALDRMIDELAPGCRLCFPLHDVDGYEHHEIAQMLGISIGTSKCQVHRARLKLRAGLQRRHRRTKMFSSTHVPRCVRL
jgi:RNA polymerase sigma factor (sigma-70 family)